MPNIRHLLLLGLALLGASPAGAQSGSVRNTATLSYAIGGGGTAAVRSNTVTLDFATKQPTSLDFRRLPADYRLSGLRCETAPDLVFEPAPIDAETLAGSTRIEALDVGTPLVLLLTNPGGNRDPALRETSIIRVEVGSINISVPLLETAPDSGVFAGGVPETGVDTEYEACDLTRARGDRIRMAFDEDDYSLSSSNDKLVDPAGYVFDSATGAVLDGAIVTLLDDRGEPAVVYGEDGVSSYPATVITGAPVTDGSGRVYPGIAGRYRFPLTEPGTYTIRVVPPAGYSAPSQADRTRLAALTSPEGAAFVLNAASFGGTLSVAGTDPIYADIPVDRSVADTASPPVLLTKLASVRTASPGDFIQYRITATNRASIDARALRIADTLPPGLRYERGSARGGAEPVVAGDGRTLEFALPPLAAGATATLSYVVTVAPGAPPGDAVNRARIANAASNEAAASVRLRPLLFSDAMTIVGRVTEGGCGDPVDRRKGVAGIRLLMEDGTFVVTDADGLYHFEGVRAGRHVVQLDRASMPATHEPVACDIDTRQAGSAISRFVEGDGGLLKRVDFQLRPTGRAVAAVDAPPIAVLDDATAAGNRDWLASQSPGIDWLFPAVDHNPRSPALRVVIKHRPGQRVALTVNGAPVEALAYDGTDADTARGVAVSRWTGIPLSAGDTRLAARVLDADGAVAATLQRTVHLAGAGIRATFMAAESRLVADGLTRPLVAVRVTDTAGRPVQAGTIVPFRVDAPYTAAVAAELESGRQLAGRERMESTARVVGDDGLAFLALQPTTQAGAARIVVSLAEETAVRTSEIRAWLSASAKDWVVVGFGAGTLGYETLSRHRRALPQDARDRAVTDGQLAFYAKGRVRGSWLLTIAYDSDRRYDPDRGLLGVIDPDRYYTIYGDGSQQAYDAATRRKLYLRLERKEFYALFGDFETGFTDTQLTRYNRTLTGVKAAYEGRRLRATGFAAKTDTLYARDEIQGNGLSGPYRLSGRRIVPNSDQLRIEVRDRFRSELIVSSTALTRHIDYDIDTILGAVRFRQPILSRDPALNPTFIVADYEVEGGRLDKLAAAGRIAGRLANGAVEVGVSGIRDETVGTATVAGIDVKARVAPATEIRAEAATGGRQGIGAGRAFLTEIDHRGGGVDLLAYARQQDQAFGVGQQNFVEAGTRKFGFDGRARIAERLSVTGAAWRQTMLGGPGTRTAGDIRLEHRRDAGTIFVGAQFASDRGVDGRARDSRLLTLGGSQTLFDGALTLTGQTQLAPGGSKGSVDFPVRHQLTATWRVTPGIRLIGGYEIADGADHVAHTAQVGFDLAPWTGAKLMSTLNQQAIGENGGRTFAQYGLSQSLPLGKRWTVDATLDASTTVRGRIPAGAVVNAFQPVASGGFLSSDQINGNYAAATLGATYRAERWSWNGRIEYRDADASDRWGVTSNILRSLGEGRTLASGLRAYRIADTHGGRAEFASADVALALRPLDSRWSLLERLELRHERADAGFTDDNALGVPAYGGGDQVMTRLVNNVALNYRSGPEGLGHGFEATLYYGAKYVRGRYAADVYDGYIDVAGFELRRDLGARFDVGVQGSVQHAWRRGAVAFSGGPSAGVSPATNVWISAGYNLAGYRDRDFEDDRYTRAGPYVTMRLKLDQTVIGRGARALFGGRR